MERVPSFLSHPKAAIFWFATLEMDPSGFEPEASAFLRRNSTVHMQGQRSTIELWARYENEE